ncbi:hypothetical protein [Streptomyces yaizuensis]|uniref:Uncharacterized protein n=1 Tax=Streptomyces yaizuensis TaxID=2989713 RepID=A0ABQ5P9T6_9ACTN|nr:hypothetical protein [Streptomyces sp. YSPA8]GLF97378.1 hypothetical protein SYYSPA8_23795 [Streptomyces sp. YSPA8]GLF99326.1 hypothetical protein SYYSPA8_33535 [Streptomyces sp. YSPA8]
MAVLKGELTVGDLAFDIVAKMLGRVMAVYGSVYFLRPVNGGREWEASREEIRPASVRDRQLV